MTSRTIQTIGMVASLALIPSASLALTSPSPSASPTSTPSSVLSDYAADVQAGQAQLAASPVALAVHNAVIAAEEPHGQIDTVKQTVDTKILIKESTKQDSVDKPEATDTPDPTDTPEPSDTPDPKDSTSTDTQSTTDTSTNMSTGMKN